MRCGAAQWRGPICGQSLTSHKPVANQSTPVLARAALGSSFWGHPTTSTASDASSAVPQSTKRLWVSKCERSRKMGRRVLTCVEKEGTGKRAKGEGREADW
eukprot:349740-Chlamydomonas_euryale.AAC.3